MWPKSEKSLGQYGNLMWNCERYYKQKEGMKEQIANLHELQIPLDRYRYDNTASVLLSGFSVWRAHA